jgi:hypothetical protein
MSRRWLLSVAVIAAVGCSPLASTAPCDIDDDCSDGEVCANHFCRARGKDALAGDAGTDGPDLGDPCIKPATSSADAAFELEDGTWAINICVDAGEPILGDGGAPWYDDGRPADAGPSDTPLPTPDAGPLDDGRDDDLPPLTDAGVPSADDNDGRSCTPDGGLTVPVILADGGDGGHVPVYDGGFVCPEDR